MFAIVSHATDRATISYDPEQVSLAQAMRVVQESGFAVEAGQDRYGTDNRTTESNVDVLGRPLAADRSLTELDEVRNRAVVATLLAMPVIALSLTPSWQASGWQWVAMVFAIPAVFWAAMPLHAAIFRDYASLSDMRDFLASISVLATFGWSLWTGISDSANHIAAPYFHIPVLLVAVALWTRWIERSVLRRAGAASRLLLRSGAAEARVQVDGTERRIASHRLHPGDYLVVGPDEKIAADAIVLAGASSIDVAALTGEAVPVVVTPGRPIACGATNVGNRLVARVARVGAQTGLAQAVRVMERVHTEQSLLRRRADRSAAAVVVAAIVLAGVTLIGWLSTGGTERDALFAAVSVLLVAAPSALALAVSTPMLVGVGRGIGLGIVISRLSGVRRTRHIDAVVADRSLEHSGVAHGELTRQMRRVRLESVFVSRGGMDEAIRQLRARKFCVAFALDVSGRVPPEGTVFAQACMGIAVGAGTFGPVPGAHMTVARRDLNALADGFALSQRISRTISGNVVWAVVYHLVMLPVAVTGVVNPVAAAAIAGLAGTVVIVNSLRLRRFTVAGR
ncbi:MAG: HAD-IC family P-type ATPase [Mycobacteriales bacterium]